MDVIFWIGTSLKTYCLMILKPYLQLGQHTFWNKSVGLIACGLIGDLLGVLEVVLLLYL